LVGLNPTLQRSWGGEFEVFVITGLRPDDHYSFF
jgi:hypothetical protein